MQLSNCQQGYGGSPKKGITALFHLTEAFLYSVFSSPLWELWILGTTLEGNDVQEWILNDEML